MIARVSNVEAFRQFRMSEDWPLERFLTDLSGEGESSPQQRVGTAFHAALENVQTGDFDAFSHGGYTFILDAELGEMEIPPIREMRIARQYGALTVSGCVDGVEGLTVFDYKTTGSFDADRYLDSYQWRYYLSLTGAERFRYLIFEISIPTHTVDGEKMYLEFDPIHVRRLHKIECFRYPEMESDCLQLAREYHDFLSQLKGSAA